MVNDLIRDLDVLTKEYFYALPTIEEYLLKNDKAVGDIYRNVSKNLNEKGIGLIYKVLILDKDYPTIKSAFVRIG